MSDDSRTADEDRPDATRVFSTVPEEPLPAPAPSAESNTSQRPALRLDARRPWTPGAHARAAGGRVDSPGRVPTWSTPFGRRVWIVVGVVVVAVVALAIATELLSTPKTLKRSSAENGVRSILANTYDLSDIGDVRCPDAIRVSLGATFTCTARIAGTDHRVVAKFTDSDGTYEVGKPD